MTLDATRAQYLQGVGNPDWIAPDGWTLDQHFLDRPGRRQIQLDLALDHHTNVALYPRWQAWLREHQPPLLILWGRHDPFFLEEGAHACLQDVPAAEVHMFDTGHFALEEYAPEIAALIESFLERRASSRNISNDVPTLARRRCRVRGATARTPATAASIDRGVLLTVQDIIDRANVGRATFYTHFDSKDDLLASGIERLRETLKERQRQAVTPGVHDDARLFAFSGELFTHANEHRAVFRAMVGKRSGAVVQQLLHKMLVDLVRDEVRQLEPPGANGMPVEAIAQFIGGGLFGLLIWWGNGKMRMPVEQVDAAFRRLAIPSLKSAGSFAK